jgi:hypothetical protein
MVEKVTGYRTSDGQLFSKELAALKHEARTQLTKTHGKGFNEAQIGAMVCMSESLCDILEPLANYHRRQPKDLVNG